MALAASEPEQSARAEAATRTETAFARVIHAAVGAFSEFLVRKDALAALAFVVLFKFTDAFSGTMTAPFVIDLGFSRNDYAAIVKGVGLAATLIGGPPRSARGEVGWGVVVSKRSWSPRVRIDLSAAC